MFACLPLAAVWVAAQMFEGDASYVSPALAGRPTASGHPFDPTKLTAASYTYFRKTVRVTNIATGKHVDVYVNDKGPARRLNRLIDLSPAAYWAIARPEDIQHGTMRVSVRILP